MGDDPALLSTYIRGHLTVRYMAVWIRAVTRNDEEARHQLMGVDVQMTPAKEGAIDIFTVGSAVKDPKTTGYPSEKTSQMAPPNRPTLFVVWH